MQNKCKPFDATIAMKHPDWLITANGQRIFEPVFHGGDNGLSHIVGEVGGIIQYWDKNGVSAVNADYNLSVLPKEPPQTDLAYRAALNLTLGFIFDEVHRAKQLHPGNFHNQHEAYAVILEEVDELWTEIKKKSSQYDLPAQRTEAIQAAAMLVRFIVELT